MANDQETVEQAVSRISCGLQSELCDGLSLAQEARQIEAALRQMAAWAYRDAARLAEAINEDNAEIPEVLLRYAKEIERV